MRVARWGGVSGKLAVPTAGTPMMQDWLTAAKVSFLELDSSYNRCGMSMIELIGWRHFGKKSVWRGKMSRKKRGVRSREKEGNVCVLNDA